MDDGKGWYFAYGSNLCAERMERRTGGADAPRIARLAGWRLAFNMRAEDGCLYANIAQPGDGVIGVIYRCDEAVLARLDGYERGYDRHTVRVTLDDGETCEATTYVARPGNTAAEGAPPDAYLAIILRGARRHGLPEGYVRSIEARARGT